MTTIANINSVGIIGCGWLGKALARQLKKQQLDIIGSCTSVDKQRELTELGIKSDILTLPTNDVLLAKSAILQQKNLVICLPPQLKNGASIYADKIANIVNSAQQTRVNKLILISSTAVYKTLTGHISETAALNVTDNKVQAIVNAESLVSNFNGYSAILRLGGLVGGSRHPGRFLSGKQGLTNGESRVNLIHQHDAVGIIIALLAQEEAVGTFNGVSSTNSSRKKFYQQAANALGLPKPEFIHQPNQQNKPDAKQIISNKKVSQQLSYRWVYPNLFTML